MKVAFGHDNIGSQTFAENDDVCDKIISQIVKMIDRADLWIIQPKPKGRPVDNVFAASPCRPIAVSSFHPYPLPGDLDSF